MRRTLTILAATAAAVAISGCVYRPTIQQGNLLQLDDIEQVQVGMTRSQVRYILGTPMVSDPFEPDRWDYVYTLQRGHDTHIDRTHFVVLFEGDKVSRVERRDLPEESAIAQRVKEERTKKAAADAKAKAAAPATPAAPSSASSPAAEPATTPAPASSPATQPPGTTPPPGG
jgi:outer membrane protein assembly factor BamE